jgi:hypothetical protein
VSRFQHLSLDCKQALAHVSLGASLFEH